MPLISSSSRFYSIYFKTNPCDDETYKFERKMPQYRAYNKHPIGARKQEMIANLREKYKYQVEDSFRAKEYNVEPFKYEEDPIIYSEPRLDELVRDQPVTFWTDNRSRLPGNSAFTTKENPFKKNAMFSTPVELRMYQEGTRDALLH